MSDDPTGNSIQESGQISESLAETGGGSIQTGGGSTIQTPPENGQTTPQDGDDDDDDEGEDLMRPSKKKIAFSDDDDDSDEEDEEEMPTEADLKFIADDDDVDLELERESKEERRKRRKERKRKRREEEEELLSDDELDLINENIGREKKKKLRKKADGDRDEIAQLFEEDDEDETQEGKSSTAAPAPAFREAELYESDDLDDFIIHDGSDEDDLDDEERRNERLQRKKERQEFAKNLGADLGISDSAWRDIEELFGTGDDYPHALYANNKNYLVGPEDEYELGEDELPVAKTKEVKLTDVYEPSEIAAKMLTEKDETIRIRDIPERMQENHQSIPDDNEISKEATVIAKTFLRDRSDPNMEKPLHTAITQVLRFYRRDFLEVPFIYTYRRDYFDGILTLPDLWRIVDLDQKFMRVESKKRTLLELIVQIASIDSSIQEDEAVASFVEKIITLDDVENCLAYVHIYYMQQIDQLQKAAGNRKSRMAPTKVLYFNSLQNRIQEFVKLYNINYSDFILSVSGQESLHFPEDHTSSPQETAMEFTSSRFPDASMVLDAAKHFISSQISVHPQLRSWIRRVYLSDALVNITPTEKGAKEIEPSHPFYPFKYLTGKPLHKFVDGQFLQIVKAESEGLITMTIRIDEEERLIADLEKFICNDYTNQLAQMWNEERRKIARYTAEHFLFPQTVKWIKDRLTTEASEFVSAICSASLERKISMNPYKLPDNDEDSPIVLAISWGDGNRTSPGFAVVLNENGEMIDFSKLDRLMERERRPDIDALQELIERHKPDVVAVGGFKPNTKTILMKIIQEEVLRGQNNVPLYLVEDEVARIYMMSARGVSEFPEADYPRLIPYCVSLGRFVQDPTCEFAGLVNKDEDIKHVRMHPLQKYLSEEALSKAVERSFMNVVGHTGVDINLAAMFPHKAHTLPFVSGLGPRKAQHLVSKIIRSGGKLESRFSLIEEKIMGKNVFVNCVAFLRIRALHFRSTYRDNALDVLDDTRVHPEDYELARKMAADALDLDDAVLEDDESPSQHVQELMEGDVDRLNLLLLDDYAVELERRTHAPKRLCLNDIKAELMNPFKDQRRVFEGVSLQEAFVMLTGESDDTLYEGVVVNTIVIRVRDRFLTVQLGSGLEGNIHINHLDVNENQDLTRIFQVNQALNACVIKINYDRLNVDLSARQSDIASFKPRVFLDNYFDARAEQEDDVGKIKKKMATQKARRTIQHPFWKSFDYKAAEEYLASRPRGEVVIRPSTKGPDHISITWKVYDGIFKHIDVLEQDKHGEWALGKTLIINSIKYHEIDQIIAEYIDPMSRRISMLLEHVKYQRKSLVEMYAYLEDQVLFLKKSVYGFIISPEDPGSFYLVYKHPKNSCRKDNILIRPKGYEFRKKMFSNIEMLLHFFKNNEAAAAKPSAGGRHSERNGSSYGGHPNGRSSNPPNMARGAARQPPASYPTQSRSRF